MGPLYTRPGPDRRRHPVATWTPAERQKAYDCDITYGTNNEFGFDYLRDNMKPAAAATTATQAQQQAQGR